jgi:hypothetical protein
MPWQGGFSVPTLPSAIPNFDSATITIAQQSAAQSGVLVSYRRGIFTKQFWSTGIPVPHLIEVLKPAAVRELRDQVVEQLGLHGSGVDDLPLRAFVTTADVYLGHEPSTRFDRVTFGSIARPAPGEVMGDVAYRNGVTGTILGSGDGISAQSHLAPFPAGYLAPLRLGDLRSLISALDDALASGAIDPLWRQMLTFAKQAEA